MTERSATEMRRCLHEGLASADEEVRRLAVEQIDLLPADEASLCLSVCLGDPAWRVRKSAVERLVAHRDSAEVRALLIDALSDGENPGRRNAAFEALVACGQEMTLPLVDELANPDVDVRKLAVDALAAIGDVSCREALRQRLEDEDSNVRASAAEALGVVGGVDEIAELLRIAVDEDQNVLVRLSSLSALTRMEAGVGVASLGRTLDSALLCPSAFELLGNSADPAAIEVLIKGLDSRGRLSRESAICALGKTLSRLDGSDADRLMERMRAAAAGNDILVDASCERLAGADLSTRMSLIQFLGMLDEPRVVVPILMAARDEAVEELAQNTLRILSPHLATALDAVWEDLDLDLKARACSALEGERDPVAERLLVDALTRGDTPLRCAAAAAIGRGGFFDHLPELIRRLEIAASEDDSDVDEEVSTLVQAIVDLAEHPGAAETGIDVQLIEMLSSRLAGAAEAVRLAIAKVLSRLGRGQDEDILGYLIRDESPAVRRAAVLALARFDFDRNRDTLRIALGDESSLVRIAAARVLGESGRLESAADLAPHATDRDPRVVAVVIRSIGHLYGESGSSFGEARNLIETALSGEPTVALAGIEALEEVGGLEAVELVTAILRRPEPDVARSAVACFGRYADPELLAELIPLVAHEDWSVRAEVVGVLSARGYRKGIPTLLRSLEVEEDAFVREAILRAVERLEE